MLKFELKIILYGIFMGVTLNVLRQSKDWKESYNHSLIIERSEELSSIERVMSVCEKSLNVCGYVPIMSSLSALNRGLVGSIEIITGQVRFISQTSSLVCSCLRGQSDIAHRSSEEALNALKLSAYGIANINRSVVEAIPVLGNLTSYVYDHCDLRLKYQIKEENLSSFSDSVSCIKKMLNDDDVLLLGA